MKQKLIMLFTIAVALLFISDVARSQSAVVTWPTEDETSLPLLQIEDVEYEGAFAIPPDSNGLLGADFSTGTIAYNSVNSSLFLAGHRNGAAVAEYSIPALINSTDLAALNRATILQNFRQVLPYTIADGHINEINEISGMALINGKLAVNAVERYDGSADNTDTGVVLQTPTDIANSEVAGYHSLQGAAHAAGWLSPIPAEWQTALGGDYIAGNSSKYSIISRLPIGVSAFVFNASDMTGPSPQTIPTTTLLDFDLSNPLYADYDDSHADALKNLLEMNGDNSFPGHTVEDADIVVGSNDLWTIESQASYGFIVPGTRTYMVLGSTGGHNSGIGYKHTQSDGDECPGFCAYDADDYYNYYWLWDVNDLLAVKNGTLNPYDIRPYDYGIFDAPFQTDVYTQTPEFHAILGGTYDADTGILYLALEDGASAEPYDRLPVIAAYSVSSTAPAPLPVSRYRCPEIAETGTVITVQNVTELQNAITQANSQNGNMTIKVEPGVYQLSNGFVIYPNMTNLTIMGTTGNREDVFIKGEGYDGDIRAIFLVRADDFTVAHMTLGEVSTHAIQIQGELDADDFTAVNIRFVDVYEQLLKVSGSETGPFSDRGRVLCSAFEFTAGIAYQFYTGGIDAHRSKNWIVQNNTFKGIRSPDGMLAEHAIHFWKQSAGTIVSGNKIENSDRGIGFGLGDSVENGHVGGLIMNNFVHTNRDVGIGLEHSPDTKVYNNTVITDDYPHSIEYRFPATSNVEIINNLVSGDIASRSGAPAITISTNQTVSDLSIFADAANYDYHLVGTPAGIVDAGTLLDEVDVDIDYENRIGGTGMDIGADEVYANTAPASIIGDVNCDEVTDIIDALFILQYTAGQLGNSGGCPISDTDTIHAMNGDVNEDQSTDIVDALFIVQCSVGINNVFCPANEFELGVGQGTQIMSESVAVDAEVAGSSIRLRAPAPIAAGAFDVAYKDEAASFIDCTSAESATAICHEMRPGIVRATYIDPHGKKQDEMLAELNFEVAVGETIDKVELTVIKVADSNGNLLSVDDVDPNSLDIYLPLFKR